MRLRWRQLLWLFTLLGLGAASTSAYVHYRLLTELGYTSACDINSTFSCSEAYLSPYGSLMGVPVAVPGVIFFLAISGLLVAGRRGDDEVGQNVPGYVFVMSTIGLAVVLYLAYGAFVVLKAVCVFCVLTYIAVIGLFFVSAGAARFPMSTLPRRILRDLRALVASPLALLLVILLVGGSAAAVAFFPREAPRQVAAGSTSATPAPALSPQQQSEVVRWFDSQPRSIVPIDPAGATVLVVKFHDFQCPPCRRTYEEYKPILARYARQAPGKVRLVTKDYPLEGECNTASPGGGHLASCEAAVASRLAYEKGAATGAKMEEWLYTNQQTLTPAVVRQAAKDVAGIQDFDAQYAKQLEQVKADAGLGALLGVRATPTFFINGVKIDGGIQPQYFDAILAHELTKAAK